MTGELSNEKLLATLRDSAKYGELSRLDLDVRLNAVLADPEVVPEVGELQRLLHELHVQQIEMELQKRELRESQQQLEEARDRYADLYDFAPVGYLTLDSKGTILDINLRGADMLGRERGRLIGVPLAPFLGHGESRLLLEHLAQVFSSGERVSQELMFKSRGVASLAVRIESVINRFSDGTGTTCHSALIDVSEQRLTEEALRQGEKRFRAIFEQASVGVAVIDSLTGRFQLINQKYSDIIGYSLEEMQALDSMQVTHPDDLLGELANMQRLLLGDIQEFTMEMRLFRKEGSVVWVNQTVSPMWDSGGQPDYHIAIIENITLRKQAEAALKGHNEVLELVANGAALDDVLLRLMAMAEEINPNLFCAVLLREEGQRGLRPFVTPGYWVFLNCSKIGMAINSETGCCEPPWAVAEGLCEDVLAHPNCVACHEVAITEGGNTCSSEQILSSTGEVLGIFSYYYREGHSPERADQEFIHGSVRLAGIAIERARAEEQTRLHQTELAHMARLNMMGEMATGMAHELNQPLSAISTYTDVALRMMRNGNKHPDKLNEALQGAGAQAMRASEIIRHLRQLVRKQEPQKRAIDLNLLVSEVVDFMHYEARKQRIKLSLELDEALPIVTVDAIQIEQVLLNLLRNSIEAFQSATHLVREVTIRTYRNSDGCIEAMVRDTGPGISASVMSQIFDPFVTTKGETGMGMGLSICRSIIEAHKGRLWARTTPGEGTAFFLTLPLAAEEQQG